jgi:hypothetical protein
MASFINPIEEKCNLFLQNVLSSNISDDENIEGKENFQRVSTFYEVNKVKFSYAMARWEASRAMSSSSSVPPSWTLPGQNPPCQSPRDMTVDQLYAQAEAAKNPYFRLHQALEVVVNADHRQDKPLPLKGKERAADKIERDYGGDASRLIDIVRGSIICRGFDEMNAIIEFLKKPETRSDYDDAYIVRIKSGFAEHAAEKTYGYRDVKVCCCSVNKPFHTYLYICKCILIIYL